MQLSLVELGSLDIDIDVPLQDVDEHTGVFQCGACKRQSEVIVQDLADSDVFTNTEVLLRVNLGLPFSPASIRSARRLSEVLDDFT